MDPSGQSQEEYLEQARRQREQELRLRTVAKQLFTPEAFERLNNIRMSNPDLYSQLIQLVLMLYQQGRISGKLSEEQLKALVAKIIGERRDSKITMLRK